MEIEFKWKMPYEEIQKNMVDFLLSQGYTCHSRCIEMSSTYYDTPDKKLKKQGMALRRREENSKVFFYVKRKVNADNSLFIRNEFVWEADCLKTAVGYFRSQSELRDVFDGMELEELEAFCNIRFERTVYSVEQDNDQGQIHAELCFDKGIGERNGIKKPISEIELEFLDGKLELFRVFANRLEREFCLEKEHSSKIAQIE